MTDTNKLEKWAFPFKTAGASSTEVSDPQLYYNALARAKDGFYPIGNNGLWHGGVHFDANTGATLDQSAVRCIADGEVIAYRIDERYPISEYINEIPLIKRAPFSTGFVLVKHRLELPALPTAPTPASAATTPTPATTTAATATPTAAGTPASAPVTATPATPAAAPASEALTFYSLYMHLLNWNGYGLPGAPTPAAFLAPSMYTVSTRPSDPQLGLRVRKEASGGDTEVLALLPKGCKVTLGAADPLKPNWQPLLSVDQGTAIPALASGVIGWVYAPQLTSNTVADLAIDDEPALTLSHQGLRVRKEGEGTGTIIGVLPRGAQLKVGPKKTNGYCKLLEVLDYKGVPALPNGPDGQLLGYVYHADLDTSLTPPQFNAVTLLASPAPIKAGELIGHLGQYQDHDEAAPRVLLHLEVFSCDDVPAFISKSQARAASLPESEKTLLYVQPGTKLVTHTASMTAANPPTVRDPGIKIGVSRTIALAVLNNLPAERKIQTSTPMLGGAPVVTQWWRLDNAFADENGNLISGWLADVISTRENPTGTRHSPWEWLGFDFISETTSSTEQLANHLAGQCLLSEAELPDYQAHISTADNGPIKTRLYDIIDGADGTARDEKLSVAEIRAALSKPWHAQSISQLISHYESEWYWQDGKWDELDKLMEHTPADPNSNWVSEKQRIKTLSWWDKVAGQHGIKAGGMAWHFHPLAAPGMFMQRNHLIDVERFIEKYTSQHESFMANTPVFSQASKGNLRTIVEYINKYYENDPGKANLFELAYMLATARHEAYYFPAGEFFSSKPEVGPLDYFNKYDPVLANTQTLRNTAVGNENTVQGDGYKYRGRGLVHLTWKINYRKAKEHFGVDFVTAPEKAAEPEYSVPIMIWGMTEGIFTHKKLARYINSSNVGYVNARFIINPDENGPLIAGYAQKFESILRETSSAKETFTL